MIQVDLLLFGVLLQLEQRVFGISYIKGSIVSRNTIGGVFIEDDDYSLGDGTTTTFLATATEYDLNKLREFRMCYPTDASGNVDETGTPIDCEGEGLDQVNIPVAMRRLLWNMIRASSSMLILYNSNEYIGKIKCF